MLKLKQIHTVKVIQFGIVAAGAILTVCVHAAAPVVVVAVPVLTAGVNMLFPKNDDVRGDVAPVAVEGVGEALGEAAVALEHADTLQLVGESDATTTE